MAGSRYRSIVLIFGLLTLTACLKDVDIGQHRIFNIPEGSHASVTTIKAYNRHSLSFAFRFDESAEYLFNDADQFDMNKLLGFKYGLDPHKNSARFGWRWDDDNKYIVISAYTYSNGTRSIFEMGHCFIGQISSAEMRSTDQEVTFIFQGVEHIVPLQDSKQRYYMFPYFGGNKKAPHNIQIELWF